MKTELDKSGFGVGISAATKAEYFKKDLEKLLKAYNVALMPHPFVHDEDIYIVNRGTSYAEGHGLVSR